MIKSQDKAKRDSTSIKMNPHLWKQVKKHCIDEEIEISSYLENLIKKDLRLELSNGN